MKFCRHTITKTSSAVVLMALMLLINAVKLLHTHPGTPAPSVLNKTGISFIPAHPDSQQINQNDHCAICDFQLARDADVTEIIFEVPSTLQTATAPDATLPAGLTAYHHSTSGRAPPALS